MVSKPKRLEFDVISNSVKLYNSTTVCRFKMSAGAMPNRIFGDLARNIVHYAKFHGY